MNLAIIGAGPFQKPLVDEARRLGYKTHVFAWEKGAVAKESADFFYPISIVEREQILKILKPLNISGVLSIASEVAVPTVAFLAEHLGLPGNSVACAEGTLNKMLMKEKFLKQGIPCAQGWLLGAENLDQLKDLDYSQPWIVKPVDRSGSLAVEKINNLADATRAAEKAIEQSFSKKCIVEQFLSGDEYSAEAVSFKGDHRIVAITKKSTTGEPFFVETGHFIPAPLSTAIKTQIERVISKALTALAITNGISHAEFKIDNEGIKLVEIGGRMGGDYIGTHLVPLSTGINFLQAAIAISTGEFKWSTLTNIQANPVGVRFINTPSVSDCRVVSQEAKRLNREIVEQSLDCEIGQQVRKTASSCTRYGHVIYKGDEISRQDILSHFGVDLI